MKILIIFSALVLLLSVISSTVSAKDISSIRGIMTDLREKYQAAFNDADGTFKCLDGSKTIKASRVNDEYCDCKDGSDEPGSAACTFDPNHNIPHHVFRFQCTNAGFPNLKQQFFHSRVNDGICDCCDGSDEYLYSDRISCPNTCAAYSAQRDVEEKKREETRQAGLAAKKLLVEKGSTQRESWKTELATLENSLISYQLELAAAEAEVTKLEPAEQAKREEIHQKSLQEKAVWDAQQAEKKAQQPPVAEEQQQPVPVEEKPVVSVEEEEANLDKKEEQIMVDALMRDANLQQQDSPITCVMWRQTRDCNGNGEREPHGDRSCNQIIEGGASGFCECKSADGGDETYPFDCGHRRLKCEKVCLLRGAEEAFEPEEEKKKPRSRVTPTIEPPKEPEFVVDDGSSFTLPEADDARRKVNDARNKIQSTESSIKSIKENMEKDWGPDGIYLGLAQDCFEKQAGEHNYKLCPMKNAWQGHTSLGNFKSFATQTYGSWGGKSDFTKMLFEGGTQCWGGPARSCEVIQICGPTNEIKSVEEPSMCAYKMIFQTPAICE